MIRELIPMLEAFGIQQEQSAATMGASTWQIFWRITLPALRWGMIYGVSLTFARALGEFGAVLVIGGGIQGQTETATLYIYRARWTSGSTWAWYSAAIVLGLLSLALVVGTNLLRRREAKRQLMSLYISESGPSDAPSLVFLHGGGVSGWMWQPQVQAFADYHCLVPDLPEHGRSLAEKLLTIEDSATRVAQLYRERAHRGKAHVVGISLGAQVIVALLSQAPELVECACPDQQRQPARRPRREPRCARVA